MVQKKLLYYIQTKLKDDNNAWFVIKAFDSIKLTLLQKKISENLPYNVRDYAEILYAGYEVQAPQELLGEVNQELGTNFSNN